MMKPEDRLDSIRRIQHTVEKSYNQTIKTPGLSIPCEMLLIEHHDIDHRTLWDIIENLKKDMKEANSDGQGIIWAQREEIKRLREDIEWYYKTLFDLNKLSEGVHNSIRKRGELW